MATLQKGKTEDVCRPLGRASTGGTSQIPANSDQRAGRKGGFNVHFSPYCADFARAKGKCQRLKRGVDVNLRIAVQHVDRIAVRNLLEMKDVLEIPANDAFAF